MNKYPCSDQCPTYAMCKQRENFQKFKVCTEYAEYIVGKIKDTQSSFDKEFGKGKRTVVGITGEPDAKYLISDKGSVISTVEAAREMTNEKPL